jgi:hypothetical protein
MKCGAIPSFSHQTLRRVSPPAPLEPNGAPLSQRIAAGSPCSAKACSNAGRTPSMEGSAIRTAIR